MTLKMQIARLWARWQSAIMAPWQPAKMVLATNKTRQPAFTELQRRLLAMGMAHANPSSLGRRHR